MAFFTISVKLTSMPDLLTLSEILSIEFIEWFYNNMAEYFLPANWVIITILLLNGKDLICSQLIRFETHHKQAVPGLFYL